MAAQQEICSQQQMVKCITCILFTAKFSYPLSCLVTEEWHLSECQLPPATLFHRGDKAVELVASSAFVLLLL